MERMTAYLLRHRRAVLIITCALLALSVIGIMNINVNSDISGYLPDSMVSRRTMLALADKFDVHGDSQCVIEGGAVDYAGIKQLVSDITALDQVNSVLWLGTYEGVFKLDDAGITSALPILSDASVKELIGGNLINFEGKNYYLLTLALTVPNSGGAAGEVMNKVISLVDAYAARTGADCFIGGNAMQSKGMLDSALGELPQFLLLASAVIAIILLLTSKSLMSSAIFLITIGISIAFNMGTNFMTRDISSITFSVAAILQLALSMDYSIFLTHAYERAAATLPPERAMVAAVKRTGVVILASALTTVAGFCALFAMEFKLGFDMGVCLAKGVVFSYASVIIVQPCLMLFFQKACEKTQHRTLAPKFNALARLPEKFRYGALILCCAIVVPATLLANNLQYYYLDSNFNSSATGAQEVEQNLGNQTVFLTRKADSDAQFKLLEQLRAREQAGELTGITGYYATLDAIARGLEIPLNDIDENGGGELMRLTLSASELTQYIEEGTAPDSVTARIKQAITEKAQALIAARAASKVIVASLTGQVSDADRAKITSDTIDEYTQKYMDSISAQLKGYTASLSALGGGDADFAAQLKGRFFAEMNGEEYTYFVARVDGQPEGDKARTTVKQILGDIDATLGQTTDYAAGNSQVVTDLSEITRKDFAVVSLLSAALILIILIFTFKGFALPLLLVALIELAIQINLAIPALMGADINFMSYVIISAIQLGATIDYAILYTNNFRALLKTLDYRRAAAQAVKDSAYSILISMSILSSACLSVYILSSDRIIKEITGLIARGSIISAAIVLVILPALCCLKRPNAKYCAQSATATEAK